MMYLGKNDSYFRASQVAAMGYEPKPLISNIFYNEKGDLVLEVEVEEDEEKIWHYDFVINKRYYEVIKYIYGFVDHCKYKGFIHCEDTTKYNTRRLYKKFLKAKYKLDLSTRSKKDIENYARVCHNYQQATMSDQRRLKDAK